MITPRDYINGRITNGQDGIAPGKTNPAKGDINTGGSSFDEMLAASIKEIESKEIHFKKELFSTAPPGLTIIGLQEPDGKGDFRKALATVLKHEGSAYVYKDGGRESSKFGILQSTAREFGYKGNIKNISQAEAESIYKKIWDRSGAASLPYPMSLIHFDTYVNSPSAARRLLKKAGDNPEKYLALRAQRYSRLAHLRPERYGRYLKGWMNRITSLKNIASAYAIAKKLPGTEINPADKAEDNSAV